MIGSKQLGKAFGAWTDIYSRVNNSAQMSKDPVYTPNITVLNVIWTPVSSPSYSPSQFQ